MSARIAGLWLAAVVAAAAPSLAATPEGTETSSSPALAVQRVWMPEGALREEAAMVLVGTALIGLAAAVRRAA